MSAVDDFLADTSQRWLVVTADCMGVMRALGDGAVDIVIADPPYDANTHKNAKTGFRPEQVGITFAPLTDVAGLVAEQLRVARRWVIDFCTLEMLAAYRDAAAAAYIRGGIMWRRDSTPQFSGDRPGQACEAFAVMHRGGRKRWNAGGKAAYYEVYIERADRVHATQKPIKCMMEMVADFTDPGDVVLDTHCGSGTTGVACLRLGRRFLGVEVDHVTSETARERLRAEDVGLGILAARAGQGALFG